MLTRIFIEALLFDEDLADQLWEAWDSHSHSLNDEAARIARMYIGFI